jgi:hypothetical protein
MGDRSRTPFLESAEAPAAGRLRRFERYWFRQRPLKTDVPFTAQSINARDFQPSEEGSGNLGRWIVDENGLPAYEYEIDQYADPRAAYPTSEGYERRDHWHQIGNKRVTALGSNDGTVQVYLGDRGGVYLNRFEAWEFERPQFQLRQFLYRILRALVTWLTNLMPRLKSPFTPFSVPKAAVTGATNNPSVPPRGMVTPEIAAQALERQGPIVAQSAPRRGVPRDPAAKEHAYGGGFSYVDDGGEIWATAYRYRPAQAQTRRLFGTGYFETATTHRDIKVKRRVYAPYGDAPFLIADIEIINSGDVPAQLSHYEYWDVNVHQLQLEWVRTGQFGPISDGLRRDVNKHFMPSVEWDETANALRFRQSLKNPPAASVKAPHEPSDIDWHPANIFLAGLNGAPNALFTDKKAFFGSGGARQPDAIATRIGGDGAIPNTTDDPMPYCFVMRHDVTLQPGERKTLRFIYGTVRPEQTLDFLEAYQPANDTFGQTIAAWKNSLVYFNTGQDPVLHREMAWHSYYVLSSTVYLDFFKTHVVPQGSAYLYLHGADGAPRDQALFALPVSYIDPMLARDMLRLIMQATFADNGQITYAFSGHGFLSNGLNLHTNPSDLDLFFLLGICEYLSATGDYGFLNEEVPFYPPTNSPAGATVLDHVRKALKHLFEVNGTGEHGLIKVGSGDWSDSIVLETALRDGPGPFGVTYKNSKALGESVMNTQMALYVLPLTAAVFKDHAPDLHDYIYDTPSQPNRITRLRNAVQAQWNPKGWYNRAILRNIRNEPMPIDHFTLESQPWALIAAESSEAERTSQAIERIDEFLDRPSPVGASLVAGGMVWPAVSQLLTWAYARTNRHQLAWRSLNRHTYAMHSHIYPNVWINTWSGPDGVNGPGDKHPGGTWSSIVTPMTDFPVMNANQDAMALFGLLRVCGIEPAPDGDGLLIDPHVPRESFVLEMPLIRLDVSPSRILVEYRAAVMGSRTLYIRPPSENVTVRVDQSERQNVERRDGRVVVPIHFVKGQRVLVEVTVSG